MGGFPSRDAFERMHDIIYVTYIVEVCLIFVEKMLRLGAGQNGDIRGSGNWPALVPLPTISLVIRPRRIS
jgi:hypothetical protein